MGDREGAQKAIRVRATAPMRVDFVGGWTDVPIYADDQGGAVVNAAIERRVRVECLLGDSRIRLHAEDLGHRVTLPSSRHLTYDGTLDLHKAALNMLPVTGGIEVLTRSDAPGGSGLGASGALDVALLAGLAHCREEHFTPEELAELGFQLEARELGLLGGRQDQYAAALGGFHLYEFGRSAVGVRPLSVDGATAEDLARHLVVAYTGHSHFSSATHERVWRAFRARDPSVVEALQAMRELADPAADALEAADWRRLAEVVDANWCAQQRLDPTIATEGMHGIEHAMRRAGAWGVKATGAGAGGCLIALCGPSSRRSVVSAAEEAGADVLDVGFASEGVRVWEEPGAALNA